jgi:hypothetical protein
MIIIIIIITITIPTITTITTMPNPKCLGLATCQTHFTWVPRQLGHSRPRHIGLTVMPDPDALGLTVIPDLSVLVWQTCTSGSSITHGCIPKQTTNKERTIIHFSCQEREKKEKKLKQSIIGSNHDMSTRNTPYRRRHVCVSSDTTDGQIWPLGSVTDAF